MVVQRRAPWAAPPAPSTGAYVYGVFKEKEKKKVMKCTYVRQLRAHTNTARFVGEHVGGVRASAHFVRIQTGTFHV